LLAAQCQLRERLDRDLRTAARLTLGDYDVLVHLSEAPGRSLRMSELADRVLLSRSGLTRRIDGLARSNLVVREVCEEDGRGMMATLTTTGYERLKEAARVHVRSVRRYLVEPLASSGGLEGLARGLAQIDQALQKG
jgi:DNA-binding MarR family transcriptional regulator